MYTYITGFRDIGFLLLLVQITHSHSSVQQISKLQKCSDLVCCFNKNSQKNSIQPNHVIDIKALKGLHYCNSWECGLYASVSHSELFGKGAKRNASVEKESVTLKLVNSLHASACHSFDRYVNSGFFHVNIIGLELWRIDWQTKRVLQTKRVEWNEDILFQIALPCSGKRFEGGTQYVGAIHALRTN